MEQTFTTYFAGLGLIGIIIGLVLLVFYVWSVGWAYKDAQKRGKKAWLIALLVMLMLWPVGLLLWFAFRPLPLPDKV